MHKTQIITISIGHLQIKINRVTNIDELYDNLIKQSAESEDVIDERIPYWADLWPSAIALSRFIVEKQLIKPSIKVHEIGCGLALPAIVCGMLGGQVMISDYLEQPLTIAQENWNLNCKTKLISKKIDWRVLDNITPACDVLIAADVAYEKRMFEPLVNVFNKLVKSGGVILFSEPMRKHTLPFYDMLKQSGFSIITHATSVLVNDFNQRVNVNVITR